MSQWPELRNHLKNNCDVSACEEGENDAEAPESNKEDALSTEEPPVVVPERTLDDGTYVIKSSVSGRKVIDVTGNKNKSRTNIQMHNSNGTNAQKWDIKRDEQTGYYTISKKGTNLVLDVSGARVVEGNNVWLYESNGSDAQLWEISRRHGYYSLISKLDKNFVLSIANGLVQNGSNVQLGLDTDSQNQLFSFITVNPYVAPGQQLITGDGAYTIQSSNKQYVVDIAGGSRKSGANAQLYSSNKTGAQRFYFHNDGQGYYWITTIGSGKAIAAANYDVVSGANVVQSDYANSNLQKWAISYSGGSLMLINKATGLVLDVAGGQFKNRTNVQIWERNNTASQKFTLSETSVLDEGIYTLESFLNASKVIDVAGASTSRSASKVHLFSANKTNAQKFQVIRMEDGNYRLRTAASGGWLTATDTGDVVQQGYSKTDSSVNNTWKPVWNGSYFSILNLATQKVIDVSGARISNGTHIQTYNQNGTDAQHFYFTATSLINAGSHRIQSSFGTLLGIANSSTSDGSSLITTNAKGSKSQNFIFKSVGTNTYVITNKNSNKSLGINGTSTIDGAPVIQKSADGSNNQRWVAEIIDGGYISLTNLNSGKQLKADRNEGAQVYQGINNDTAGFGWKILSPANWCDMGWLLENNKYYFVFADGHKQAFNKSSYRTYAKIANLKSRTKYLISVDRDLTYTNVYLKQNDIWVPHKTFLCSVGRGGVRTTPAGLTKIGRRVYVSRVSEPSGLREFYVTEFRRHTSSDPKLGGSGGYYKNGDFGWAFHSVLYKGYTNKVGDGRLGRHISNGCVRIATANAKWIYNNIIRGTTCFIY